MKNLTAVSSNPFVIWLSDALLGLIRTHHEAITYFTRPGID
jgi:hypothetical protein